jgi:nucleotide-binding universal stress UspA family protein
MNLPSFTHIVLVTDFSECSAVAVPLARAVADCYRAAIFVTHVMPDAGSTSVATEPYEARKAQSAAEERMQQVVASSALVGAQVETIIEHGSITDVLARVIPGRSIDLVVVGTHGRSGVGKLFLGSVAQRIFNVVPCPVLSVSPRAGKSWSAARKFKRILYPTDFSGDSLKALPYALSLVRIADAELILLHVADDLSRNEVLQEYYRRLNALIPPEARAWCKSDALVITGDRSEAILNAASEQNADLVVISAHGAAGAFNVPLTTAYQVVARAPCPVLRVRT